MGQFAVEKSDLNGSDLNGNQQVSVSVLFDPAVEPLGTFGIVVQRNANDPVSAFLAKTSFIINDLHVDPLPPSLIISSYTSGSLEANQYFDFTITRLGDTSGPSSVSWTVTGSGSNPASANDFEGGILPSGIVNFAANEESKIVFVNVLMDNEVEPDEGFDFILSSPVGATLSSSAVNSVIWDVGTTILEASGSTRLVQRGNIFFLRDAIEFGPSLKYQGSDVFPGQFGDSMLIGAEKTSDGYLVAWKRAGLDQYAIWNTDNNGDYTNSPIPVVPASDVRLQALEPNFQQDLNGDGRIGLPSTLSISAVDANKLEGIAGLTAFLFAVSRSGETSGAASATYAVAGGGLRPASAIDFADGALPSGTVSFAAGETTKQITIAVAGDTGVETHETFEVTLSAPSAGSQIGTATATGTIVADDTITDLAVLDSQTNQILTPTVNYYTGPVAGLDKEFILITPASINVSASGPNWFIHSGSGTDALAAHSGRNVLDGGTGSNFLVGASGEDTFFLDNRDAKSTLWSTVVGFGKGDSATIWGVTQDGFKIDWLDGLGAEGFTGLTMKATAAGKPDALLTLAGYTVGDISNGRLQMSFGAIDPTTPYLYVYGTA